MRKLLTLLALSLVVASGVAMVRQQNRAQPAKAVAGPQRANPVMSALRTEEARYEQNLVRSAEMMPADKYGTKPTEQQATFGHLVLHVAQSNNMLCSSISGKTAPGLNGVTESAGKDALVGALKQSFTFCRDSLAEVGDSGLAEEVPSFGGPASRATVVLHLAADWGDHYSLMATEMRLAGLLPPTAMRAH